MTTDFGRALMNEENVLLRIKVLERPKSWQRTGGGPGGVRFKDTKTKEWEKSAIGQIRDQLPEGFQPLDQELSLSLVVVYPRAKKLDCTHTSGRCKCTAEQKGPVGREPLVGTTDLDNLVKRAGDTLERASVVKNDRLIVGLHPPLYKCYAGTEPQGMYIELRAFDRSTVREKGWWE